MSTRTEPGSIAATRLSLTSRGRRTDDEHGADDEVGGEAGVLDHVLARGEGREASLVDSVEGGEPGEVAVDGDHLGVHADGDGGGVRPGDTGTDHDDPARPHPGTPLSSTPRPPAGRWRCSAPAIVAIRPAISLIGARSGSEPSGRRTVS